MKTFKRTLIESRMYHGLSQTDLSIIIGVSRTQISFYESGLNTPGLDVAIRLSKLLGFSLDQIQARPRK